MSSMRKMPSRDIVIRNSQEVYKQKIENAQETGFWQPLPWSFELKRVKISELSKPDTTQSTELHDKYPVGT